MQDGGFNNDPLAIPEKAAFFNSNPVTSLQAIYIIETAIAAGASVDSSKYALANSYLRHLFHTKLDLETSYYLVDILNNFNIDFGTPRWLQYSLGSIGFIFLSLAILFFYKSQFPEEALNGARSFIQNITFLLTCGIVSVLYAPQISIVVYLALAFYLVIQYYEIQSTDATPDGMMVLVSSVNTLAFMTIAISLTYLSAFIFAHPSVFYILGFWSIVANFAVTYGGAYFITPRQKMGFYVKASVLAWITNIVLLVVFLFGRGDMDFMYHLALVRGSFPMMFVAYPVVTLILSYFSASVAYLLYAAK